MPRARAGSDRLQSERAHTHGDMCVVTAFLPRSWRITGAQRSRSLPQSCDYLSLWIWPSIAGASGPWMTSQSGARSRSQPVAFRGCCALQAPTATEPHLRTVCTFPWTSQGVSSGPFQVEADRDWVGDVVLNRGRSFSLRRALNFLLFAFLAVSVLVRLSAFVSVWASSQCLPLHANVMAAVLDVLGRAGFGASV